jgi:NarL family two-component system response regulator YdfI
VVRVILVSFPPLLGAALISVLGAEPDIVVIGSVAGEEQLRVHTHDAPPDLLLIHVRGARRRMMPQGANAMGLLNDAHTRAELVELLHSGYRALLPDDATAAEIVAAVRAVGAGVVVIHPDYLDLLFAPARNNISAPTEQLTPRELEVLALMAEGAGNKTIARRLQISDHTVKYHVASILAKLHATSRTEAVSQGIRHGLVLL